MNNISLITSIATIKKMENLIGTSIVNLVFEIMLTQSHWFINGDWHFQMAGLRTILCTSGIPASQCRFPATSRCPGDSNSEKRETTRAMSQLPQVQQASSLSIFTFASPTTTRALCVHFSGENFWAEYIRKVFGMFYRWIQWYQESYRLK